MVIDETLTEDPELVRAAASATLLAVENGALEGELRASRARILEAGHAERRRIERDLHDSTQQRLVALRHPPHAHRRAARGRAGARRCSSASAARSTTPSRSCATVAHGIYPPVLGDRGVGAALEAVARSSAMPIRVGDEWRGRQPEAIETTVYFCCLECTPERGQARAAAARP